MTRLRTLGRALLRLGALIGDVILGDPHDYRRRPDLDELLAPYSRPGTRGGAP